MAGLISANKGLIMLYHVYFDQGGVFGTPKLLVSKSKLRQKAREHDISNYYAGRMTGWAINQWIRLFNEKAKTSIPAPTVDGMSI